MADRMLNFREIIVVSLGKGLYTCQILKANEAVACLVRLPRL